MKTEIVERLGQTDLLLPSLIAEGLVANDRVKVRLSILQAAARRVRDPQAKRFDLANECRAAGIDPVAVEAVVGRASLSAGERITAPGLGSLGTAIWNDVETMVRAVKAGDAAQGDSVLKRLSAIRGSASLGSSDDIELAQIARLTGLADRDGDSLHRLIMDLHKDLNSLAAAHAEEVLAGAHVYALLPEDRSAIEAFMRGVEATRKLKFSHPVLRRRQHGQARGSRSRTISEKPTRM